MLLLIRRRPYAERNRGGTDAGQRVAGGDCAPGRRRATGGGRRGGGGRGGARGRLGGGRRCLARVTPVSGRGARDRREDPLRIGADALVWLRRAGVLTAAEADELAPVADAVLAG